MHDGLVTVPMLVDDTPIVLFRVEDRHLLLTIQLFDATNELLVQVLDNELVFSAHQWDVEFRGRRLIVRSAPREIFVGMTFEPPGRVVINQGHLWRNGIEIAIRPTAIVLGHGIEFSGNSATDCTVGFATGNVPDGISTAFQVPSPRAAFAGDPLSEGRVVTIDARQPLDCGAQAPIGADDVDALVEGFRGFLDEVSPDDFGVGGDV